MKISRVVVVDASPIIGLSKGESLGLLRGLFGEIHVTDAVRDEVFGDKRLPGAAELETAIADGWVQVVASQTNAAFADLGAGEATTLSYAHATGAGVLIDDRAGRRQAAELNLDTTTTVAVLTAAKRQGLVTELRPLFRKLREPGFGIAEDAVQAALDETGEG